MMNMVIVVASDVSRLRIYLKACLRRSCLNSPHYHARHADQDHDLTRLGEFHVILAQPPVPIEPTKRSPNDPALGLDGEALLVLYDRRGTLSSFDPLPAVKAPTGDACGRAHGPVHDRRSHCTARDRRADRLTSATPLRARWPV